jgi:tyrosyl-tRNA synthetase
MSSNASTSVDEKFQLITRRLQEVLGGDLIKEALEKAEQTGQPVRLYWGTAPTGRRRFLLLSYLGG